MLENVNNFLTEIIDEDIKNGLSERIHTRFPPEPNGYLHIGSAKAIFINWSIAKKYNGLFNLRYDDTNPVKEDTEYVDSIWEDIKWLTGEEPSGGVYYGSDYFETCFNCAVQLIKDGKAYVDDLTQEEMRQYRGSLTEPGKPSPYRDRSVEENLQLFQDMRDGKFADGAKTLRAKIDYGFATAATTMGSIGVQVWVYHGEVLPGQKAPQPALEGSSRPNRSRRNDRRERGDK